VVIGAEEEGHLAGVDLLSRYEADMDAVSSYGTSPLHCAVNGGHNDIIRLFLPKRANHFKSTCYV
jgi:ankyrin repeat protein